MDRSIIEQYIEEKNKQIEEKELLKKQREEEIEQAKKDAYQQQKRDFLYSEGMYEIEYSKDGKESEEYPEYDYDQTTGDFKFYKYVFPEISDEEYEQLKALKKKAEGRVEKGEKSSKSTNGVAHILEIISRIIALVGGTGIGISFVFLCAAEKVGLAFAVLLVGAFSVLVESMIFMGFAEIIKLLNDIKNK